MIDISTSARTSRCEQLAHPNIPNFIVSILLLLGIWLSYLPQHYRIIARRSSEGLSPYFVLLGATSSISAAGNILTLPTSQADIGCCKRISSFACGAGLLGIAQVGSQCCCFLIILLLFLVFFPRQTSDIHSPRDTSPPQIRDALIVVAVSMLHLLIVFIVSVVLYARYPSYLQAWANFLGIVAAALACIQYIPQLWTTWKLQAVMSLSIPMMCLQTPGSFVFAANLAVRLGISGWSAWGVYIVTGMLQGCLLAMGVVFEARERKKRKAGVDAVVDGRIYDHLDPAQLADADDEDGIPRGQTSRADERTPLVRERSDNRSSSVR